MTLAIRCDGCQKYQDGGLKFHLELKHEVLGRISSYKPLNLDFCSARCLRIWSGDRLLSELDPSLA